MYVYGFKLDGIKQQNNYLKHKATTTTKIN